MCVCQTFLRIAGVDVDLVPSNNHASPSGALPFLLPPSSTSRPSVPLTGAKIHTYARDNASHAIPDISTPRLEAYEALLTQSLRPAWVCLARSFALLRIQTDTSLSLSLS